MDELLKRNPEFIGDVDQYYKHSKSLPFLFKILSIAQPLSLQAHPDRELAQILRSKDPKNYPDSNHKPELAIALTEFHVLCDFRPMAEIVKFVKHIGPLRRILGEKNCNNLISNLGNAAKGKHALSDCFTSLMTCPNQQISDETNNLITKHEDSNLVNIQLLKLVEHLAYLYPGDPGIFAPFFLNYIKLSPGEAIYLKPKKLHAYIKGDCIECMACSDNVVRAALTNKFRDVDNLIKMLDYECVSSSRDILLSGHRDSRCESILTFAPTPEFQVDMVKVKDEMVVDGSFMIPAISSGSFVIFMEGEATAGNFYDRHSVCTCKPGSSWFVPAQVAVKLNIIKGLLVFYRAHS